MSALVLMPEQARSERQGTSCTRLHWGREWVGGWPMRSNYNKGWERKHADKTLHAYVAYNILTSSRWHAHHGPRAGWCAFEVQLHPALGSDGQQTPDVWFSLAYTGVSSSTPTWGPPRQGCTDGLAYKLSSSSLLPSVFCARGRLPLLFVKALRCGCRGGAISLDGNARVSVVPARLERKLSGWKVQGQAAS